MKNFLKLLSFEINRFIKLYVMMLVVIFMIQCATVLFSAFHYMRIAKDATRGGRISPEQFLDEYMPYDLGDSLFSAGFLIPLGVGVASLMMYLFFIWYRDWFARN